MSIMIFDPIIVRYRNNKQKLRPYENAADASFLDRGGVPQRDWLYLRGLTVAKVADEISFGVPPEAAAFVNGIEVEYSAEVLPGDKLTFQDRSNSDADAEAGPDLPGESNNAQTDNTERPIWDSERKRLSYKGEVAKQFTNIGSEQKKFMEAWKEAGFPDPLEIDPLQYTSAKKRTDFVYRLNESLDNESLLHFECDGLGVGYVWKDGPRPEKPSRK